MDNLVKVLKCIAYQDYECPLNCPDCQYYQTEYRFDDVAQVMEQTINKITALKKSNRNWRRKTQRLRRKLKEKE